MKKTKHTGKTSREKRIWEYVGTTTLITLVHEILNFIVILQNLFFSQGRMYLPFPKVCMWKFNDVVFLLIDRFHGIYLTQCSPTDCALSVLVAELWSAGFKITSEAPGALQGEVEAVIATAHGAWQGEVEVRSMVRRNEIVGTWTNFFTPRKKSMFEIITQLLNTQICMQYKGNSRLLGWFKKIVFSVFLVLLTPILFWTCIQSTWFYLLSSVLHASFWGRFCHGRTL